MKTLARRSLSLATARFVAALTALACLPIALRMIAPDAAFSVLLPVALIGAVAGFSALTPPVRKTPAMRILVVAGIGFLFLRVGGLGGAVAAAMEQAMRMAVTSILPATGPERLLQSVAGWLTAQDQASQQVSFFAQRSAAWLTGFLRGTPLDDPAPHTFFLAIGMWLLGCWTGWRLSTKDDPLGALLPTTALLGLTLSSTVQNRWPLWLHMTAFMLLVSISNLAGLRRAWQERRTDYSDSIQDDSFLTGLMLIILVLSVAFAVSSVSVKDIVDRFRRPPEATSGPAAGPSSSRAGDAGNVRSGAFEGLQNTHIINAGPVLSKDVVMYVRMGDLPTMTPAAVIDVPAYYWRGATYQAYTGRGWVNPIREDIGAEALTELISPGIGGFRKVHGIVRLPKALNGVVYWTGTLLDADVPLDIAWRAGPSNDPGKPASLQPGNADVIGAVAHEEPGARRDTYAFDSLMPEASEGELRSAPARYPQWVSQRYLQLPDSVPERVRALARDVTAQGRTPYDRALAIERYLRRIPYSLEAPAPPSEQDATDFFLFDLKKGYCDYYATAMTVMARSAGLPARLVTGYASGSYDPTAAEYIVTKADAHAWTEIYFTGIGWIEFEPTAGQPAPGRESAPSEISASPATGSDKQGWIALPALEPGKMLLMLWAIPAMLAAALAWGAIDDLRLGRMRMEQAMRRIYIRMRRATRPLTGDPVAGETALEHARTVSARLDTLGAGNRIAASFLRGTGQLIRELTELYMLCLFAPQPLRREEQQRAILLWRAAQWRLSVLEMALIVTNRGARPGRAPSSLPESQPGQSHSDCKATPHRL